MLTFCVMRRPLERARYISAIDQTTPATAVKASYALHIVRT